MNIEKIAGLLGQLQNMIGAFDALSARSKSELSEALKANGIDPGLLAKNAAKEKSLLQDMPSQALEPLLAISTTHVNLSARMAMLEEKTDGWGVTIYCNEYGGFVYVNPHEDVSLTAPESIQGICRWAKEHGFVWIKLDCDGSAIEGLPVYEGGDVILNAEQTQTVLTH